jgi:glycyl-radical enzyme activating protein
VTGIVFNVQRFCVHDGPGIRTAVFLKGCPLRCAWCHNPEGLSPRKQLMLDTAKCTHCGACAAVCERHTVRGGVHTIDRASCAACGTCTKACPNDALAVAGKEMSVSEIMNVVLRDAPFYAESGGGLTLTGGEPTLQGGFALALARDARREGIHVAVETCGFAKPEVLAALAETVDLFLYDIKETDSARHLAYTGQGNELILENLRMLDSAGAKIILRCPIIPSFNDRREHYEGIARLANGLRNVQEIEIEPYHPLGLSKAEKLGMAKDARLSERVMPKDDAKRIAREIRKHTDVPVKP